MKVLVGLLCVAFLGLLCSIVSLQERVNGLERIIYYAAIIVAADNEKEEK